LIGGTDKELVITGFVVQTDEKDAAGGISKTVNGMVTWRDGVFERKSNSIEAMI
jgi:hypothetical protein